MHTLQHIDWPCPQSLHLNIPSFAEHLTHNDGGRRGPSWRRISSKHALRRFSHSRSLDWCAKSENQADNELRHELTFVVLTHFRFGFGGKLRRTSGVLWVGQSSSSVGGGSSSGGGKGSFGGEGTRNRSRSWAWIRPVPAERWTEITDDVSVAGFWVVSLRAREGRNWGRRARFELRGLGSLIQRLIQNRTSHRRAKCKNIEKKLKGKNETEWNNNTK